jgi:hypothetical protein
MGKCSTTVRTIHFDLTDEQVTKVTVGQDYAGDCPLMNRRYEKTFPARIPITDVEGKPSLFTMEGGIKDYLLW